MIVYKIKSDKVDSLKEWGHKLMNEYKSEALETLREENCHREFFQLFQVGTDWYAAVHMEGDFVPANADREINKQHRKILTEAIEEKIPVTVVYDLVV